MNVCPLALSLMLLFHPGLCSFLPAPVNVSVNSVNFQHVLRWDPGPGTLPGTRYKVFRKEEKKWKRLATLSKASFKLKLEDPRQVYVLMVKAFYNQTLCSKASTVRFAAYEETKIGRPELSLAGCGTCIRINISMPEAEVDIHMFYRPKYRVLYQKHDGKQIIYDTENRSLTLSNLQGATKYCVQVQPLIRLNRNTQSSAWRCVFTSAAEVNKGPVIGGAVAALLIVVLVGLTTFISCLRYTGFIGKLKVTLPRPPIAALSRGYILTLERTIPDQISISPEVETQSGPRNPRTPATKGSDLEEEEEEGVTAVYIDRAKELSSGEGPQGDPADGSGTRTPTPSADSDSSREEVEGFDEDEAEGAGVCLIHEGSVPGAAPEEDEVAYDGSGDVDLFSLTLTALTLCEEEEQNTEDVSGMESLLPGWALTLTDSQTESHDQTAAAAQEHFTGTGYEGRRADTPSDGETMEEEQEEEEEEEEFSGYMRHT